MSYGHIQWEMAGQNIKKIMPYNVFDPHILDRYCFSDDFFCETGMVSDGNECATGSCGGRCYHTAKNTPSDLAGIDFKFSVVCECGTAYT